MRPATWLSVPVLVAVLGGIAPAVAHAAEPATESTWGDGQLSQQDGVTRLTVPHGSGGVEFRYSLDPNRRYKVVLDGRNVTNYVTLRWQLDGDSPEYQAAPQAPFARTVEGVSDLDVMLYQDTPATYDLHDLTVEACSECQTDAQLHDQILADVPGLAADLQSDRVAAAQKLLQWAAPRIHWAATSDDEIDTFASSAVDTFDLNFTNGRSGVWCGGAADALRKLLELFGIDADRVDIGDPETPLTHAVVAMEDNGHVYMLDPTFGIRYTDQAGQPISLDQVWDDWLSGDDADVQVHAEDLSDRVVVDGSDTPPTCSETWSTGCDVANFVSAFEPDLAADGIRRDSRVGLDFLVGSDHVSLFRGPQAVFDALEAVRDRVRADPRLPKLRRPPVPRTAPTISGAVAPGHVVSATGDAWDALAPITARSYQWLLCDSACAAISGATSGTYAVTQADLGTSLRVRVGAANAFGSGSDQTSAGRLVGTGSSTTTAPATGSPATTPVHTSTPVRSSAPAKAPATSRHVTIKSPAIVVRIHGVARVGHRLTCSVPRRTAIVRRAWKRGHRILGRRSTYVVKRADRGRTLTCHVRVRKGKRTRIVGAHVRVRRS